MEQNKDFYNSIYLKGGANKEYFKTPEDCIYYPIWNYISFGLLDDKKILDIGCGVGQLANFLIKRNKNYVRGVDFSDIAIKRAKEQNITNQDKFILGDIYDINVYDIEYDIAILCEVLEHLEDDFSILNNLKKGTIIYLTVPSYLSKGHVRCFKTLDSVQKRYYPYIKDIKIKLFTIGDRDNYIYLLEGVKR